MYNVNLKLILLKYHWFINLLIILYQWLIFIIYYYISLIYLLEHLK